MSELSLSPFWYSQLEADGPTYGSGTMQLGRCQGHHLVACTWAVCTAVWGVVVNSNNVKVLMETGSRLKSHGPHKLSCGKHGSRHQQDVRDGHDDTYNVQAMHMYFV